MKNYKIVLLEILIVSSFIGTMLYGSVNTHINYNSSNKDNSINSVNNGSPQIADDFIPTPEVPNENFTWGFSNGTEIGFIYERYNDTDYSFGVNYFNITSMPYLFIDEPEMMITNFTYCVQLEEIYFNLTQNKILPVQNNPLLNVSFINLTTPFFGGSTGFLLPMLPGGEGPFPGWFLMMLNPFIPMNDTTLALTWSAQRLKLIYENMIEMGELDIASTSFAPNNNNIYFKNSTSKAYVNLTYYDNGSLLYGEIYYNGADEDEEEDWMTITLATIPNALNLINPVDDLEWDVEVGDCLYFGIERQEIELNITSIYNYSYYNPQADSNFIFQVVNASLSILIPEFGWMSYGGNMTISAGNELFPAFFTQELRFRIPFILPMGYDTEKLAMVYKMMSDHEDYDLENTFGDNWLRLYNSTNQGFAVLEFSSNGSALLFQTKDIEMLFDHTTAGLYRKNMTIIDSTHSIDIIPLSTSGFAVTLNISVTDTTQLLYSAFDINPINTSSGIGNYGLLFIDVMVNESGNLDQAGTDFQPINITIEFDHTKYKNMKIFYFNTSSESQYETWTQIPYVKLADGKIMFTVNYSSIFAFTNVPISILPSGGDDDDDDDKETVVIPFGNYYLVFLAVGVISLVYYYKKRKI